MANRLREIFSEREFKKGFKQREQLRKIQEQLICDKHCSFCKNSIEQPHYEMGYEAGTDPYCKILNELRSNYPTGQQCLFWELDKRKVNVAI